MTTMIDKLWPAFYEEVSQQIENVSQIFHEPENLDVDVDQAFRDFHTVGSSCAMMGFSSMEEIARACEDLLGKVRNADLALNTELNTALRAASTCLGQQLAMAEESKENPNAFPDLVLTLKSFLAEE